MVGSSFTSLYKTKTKKKQDAYTNLCEHGCVVSVIIIVVDIRSVVAVVDVVKSSGGLSLSLWCTDHYWLVNNRGHPAGVHMPTWTLTCQTPDLLTQGCRSLMWAQGSQPAWVRCDIYLGVSTPHRTIARQYKLLHKHIKELSNIISHWLLFLSIIMDHLLDVFILHESQKAPAAETEKSTDQLQ